MCTALDRRGRDIARGGVGRSTGRPVTGTGVVPRKKRAPRAAPRDEVIYRILISSYKLRTLPPPGRLAAHLRSPEYLNLPAAPSLRPPHARRGCHRSHTHGRICKCNSRRLHRRRLSDAWPSDHTQRLYMCTLDRLRGAAPGVKPETGKRNSHNGGEDDPRSAPLLSPPHRYHIAQCPRVDASHTHEDTSRAAGEALILSRCHASMA